MHRLHVRPLRPDEPATVQTVFDGLSPASRERRFHAPVKALTPGMLAALCAVDGVCHVAVVAEAREHRRWVPVGIARYVLDADGRGELAVSVVDRHQGRGVGRALLRELVAHARDHGVVELYGDVLTDNAPIRALLTRALPAARFTAYGATTRVSSVLRDDVLTLEDVVADLAWSSALA